MFDALIKVGGSLYTQPNWPAVGHIWVNLAATHRLLFLPGGGPFANQVRAADARFHLSDTAAHCMAILAMDQYAYLLTNQLPTSVVVRTLAAAEQVCAQGRVAILAPSTLLLQLDPLPHSWHITSDSIAAWLANYAGIELLVLLKSVAGVYAQNAGLQRQVSAQSLTQSDVVDAGFANYLFPNTRCWILDGRQPERLAELLQGGYPLGTEVARG